MKLSQWIGAAILVCPIIVNAAIIDFESVSTSNCQVTNGGSVDGFTLSPQNNVTSAGFNNVSACSFLRNTAHSGSQFMLNFNSEIGSFTRDVGNFDLLSLWVAADIRRSPAVVRFQGLDGVGGNVLFSMDVNITSDWSQVLFSGWNDVKTFTWDSLTPSSSNIAIDDFEYRSGQQVPEPGPLALLGLAFAGLGWSRRKRG